MPAEREIRSDYDRETIVVYQAYAPAIADAALAAGRFVPPFSFGRMTWIKPSFLWLMAGDRQPARYRHGTTPDRRDSPPARRLPSSRVIRSNSPLPYP